MFRFKSLALIATLPCALVGCNQPDPAFGSNFDSCLLRNHANADGDTATEICERHWERAPTDEEQKLVKGKARLDQNVAPPELFGKPLGKVENRMTAMVTNSSKDFIVTEITMDVDFKDGQSTTPLTWTLPLRINPDDYGENSGTFGGGKVPSTAFSARVTASKIISHTH